LSQVVGLEVWCFSALAVENSSALGSKSVVLVCIVLVEFHGVAASIVELNPLGAVVLSLRYAGVGLEVLHGDVVYVVHGLRVLDVLDGSVSVLHRGFREAEVLLERLLEHGLVKRLVKRLRSLRRLYVLVDHVGCWIVLYQW